MLVRYWAACELQDSAYCDRDHDKQRPRTSDATEPREPSLKLSCKIGMTSIGGHAL